LIQSNTSVALALQLTGVSKSIGSRQLFAGLELRIPPGEFVALMGESGSGKSTLLNLIAGLDSIDEGQILVNREKMQPHSGAGEKARLRAKHLGFVFQAFHLLPHLSLCQNVAVPLLLLKVPFKESMQRALAALKSVGLDARAHDKPGPLSGGEQQRVALARAIVHQPALLLADEPTGNLDPASAAAALALMQGVAKHTGAAILMVTHSAQAAASADRTVRLTPTSLVPITW
jgi:putative ABC transport system ATP-binding protein